VPVRKTEATVDLSTEKIKYRELFRHVSEKSKWEYQSNTDVIIT
jgi:hypothetical protein